MELIEHIIRKAGRPLHYKEILLRLKTEENFDMPGKDPAANLTARLSINSQFVRVGKGTYTLQETPPEEMETTAKNSAESQGETDLLPNDNKTIYLESSREDAKSQTSALDKPSLVSLEH